MEREPQEISDVVRIGGERYHLRDFTDDELTGYINHRTNDIDRAVEDIGVATSVWAERHPEEVEEEALGERVELPPFTD